MFTGNLSAIYEGFCLIDTNHSGTISSGELAAVLKAMGTRATAEELEDMVGVGCGMVGVKVWRKAWRILKTWCAWGVGKAVGCVSERLCACTRMTVEELEDKVAWVWGREDKSNGRGRREGER